MEGVLPWANGGAHKPCRLQGQFKEEGRDFLELIWWSQNKWLPWFSWENIIAFLNFFFFFYKRDLWCNWPESVQRDLGQDSKRLMPCPQASEAGCSASMWPEQGAEVALDRSHPSQRVSRCGFWQIKDGSADKAGVGGVRAFTQSSPSTGAKRKRTWTVLDRQRRRWTEILAKSQSKRREQ